MDKNYPNHGQRGQSCIYINEGDIQECAAYRPICLAQIAYKIWPSLITHRIAKIMHIVTSNKQYGYKSKISTVGAIMKIGKYIGRK